MLVEFEKNIADFIKANQLFGPTAKVLLAVSGGADSMALLYAMRSLKADGVFNGRLIVAHINHQLRGLQAKLDEDFVITQAGNLNLPVVTRRLDVRGFARKNKLSIETAARKLRIESLLDIAKANNCNYIATAHQKNDNAETILQRLARGTGFRGLAGIWPTRTFAEGVCFVRPLLCVSRNEVVEYLKEQNLKWRIDRTNEDCKYRRNYIRHRLMPALQQQCSGPVVEQLSVLAQSTRRFHSLVCSSAEKVWPGLADCAGEKVKLELKIFSVQPEPVKIELIRRSLAAIGSGERNLTQQHFKRILQLAEQNVGGKKIELPDGFVVWREYEKLIFVRTDRILKPDEQIVESVKVEVPGRTRFGNYLIESAILEPGQIDMEKFKVKKNEFVERFDLDKVKLPLAVRFRRAGDRFCPLGQAGKKRIGKFMTAAKVPLQLRRESLIVADSKKIIWLWPIRMCEQAKIISSSRKILQLKITDTNSAH